MRALAADNFPAGAVGIAAGIGIEQEGDDRVAAQRFEEILRAGARTIGAAHRAGIFVEGMEDFVLLLRRGGGEFVERGEKLFRAGGEFGQAFAIVFLFVDGEGGERLVDEVDDAGFVSAGRVVGGNDARGDRVDFDGLFWR